MTILGILVILSFIGCTKQSKPEPVNVILISIDALRADYLNSYGYSKHKVSPNIDALGRDGILHMNHITASPWTTPSHMSLLTSMHPSSHGVIQSFQEFYEAMAGRGKFNSLAEERLTLSEALKANGYSTGAFTGGITLDGKIGFDQGFMTYMSDMYKISDSNMGRMLEWVDRHAGEPFFLFWHTFEVHAPYLSGDLLGDDRAGLREKLDQLRAKIGDEGSLAHHVNAGMFFKRLLKRHSALNLDVCTTLYAGGVLSVDRWIGRLVAFLKERNLYDRTLIVLTSDHGEEFADHDPQKFYDEHGHSAYEEMIRIPLIVKLPKSRHAGLRIQSPSRAIDVMPTVLDVAGIALKEHEMQGESLVSLWEGKQTVERMALTEGTKASQEVKSLRTGRFKYIIEIAPETVASHGRSFVPAVPERTMLFDLTADPTEKVNLLDKGGPPDSGELATLMDTRLRTLAAAKRGKVGEVELDEETLRALKGLGYVH
jgi:arylsulfatase A-like enzyme